MEKNYKKAFSLIELLISLIIISLLVAAFAPIITKKLKASDISIGSFGSGSNVNMTLERQVTKEDCDKYDAIFIPAAMNGGARNICVTRYNVGDNADNSGVAIAKGVKILSVGETCPDKEAGNCCWQGKTSGNCGNSGNGDSDYSGCNRTVCNLPAANASCASYAPNNENEGRWRIPNSDEITAWGNNLLSLNNNKGKEGLQFCDQESSSYGAVLCDHYANKCPTSNLSGNVNNCYPTNVWANSIQSGESNTFRALAVIKGKLYLSGGMTANSALGARCILDSMTVDISELPGNGIKDPSTDPFYGEPASQEDCDKIVAIFIDKKMSGANRNICVSKYNAGDAGPDGFGPPIPDSFGQYIMGIGQTCPYAGNCCWKGKTAGACNTASNNAGANYSGCNRTVCQWNAANAACRLYNAFGATATGAWRLPTQAEYSVWTQYFNEINNNKGKDGLQLCSSTAAAGFSQCERRTSGCSGTSGTNSYSGGCYPGYVWSQTSNKQNTYAILSSATSSIIDFEYTVAASVRCVYDGITKANNYENDLSDWDDTNAPKDEPKSQEDCEKLTAIFIHKKYTGGARNLCISKYNVGDSGPEGLGPNIPAEYSKNILTPGQYCTAQGYCCYKGKTADTCGISGNVGANYSGCNRTVCQWNVANEACKNYIANGKTKAGYWRLPNIYELQKMGENKHIINNNRGKDGLQLCAGNVVGGFVQCKDSTTCMNSNSNYCLPGSIWSETLVGTNTYAVIKSDFILGSFLYNFSLSARCVYDGSDYSDI